VTFYTLKGNLNGREFADTTHDIKALQTLLTKVLRLGGSGFIFRGIL
jgi:hypothetical protein